MRKTVLETSLTTQKELNSQVNNPTKKNNPTINITAKSQKLKLMLHPPSIPTSLQTFRYENNESRAFNTTTTRFPCALNDLPGPGYYKKDIQTDDESQSKFGTTGFASRNPRFSKYNDHDGGPAYYNINKEQTASSKSISAAFKKSERINRSGPIGCGFDIVNETETPAPGVYDYKSKEGRKGGCGFVFKSRSRRGFVNGSNPPPGAYNLSFYKSEGGGAVAAFKSTRRRDFKLERGPAPNSYDPVTNKLELEKRKPGPFISILQFVNPKEKLFKNAPSQQRPFSTTSSIITTAPIIEKHHEKKIDFGFRGSYIEKRLGPGPGAYDIALAAEKTKRIKPVDLKGIFSGASRAGTLNDKAGLLGPGFYQPIHVGIRSFRLNLEKTWTA